MAVHENTPRDTGSKKSEPARKPQVVIVGAGFGGLAAAKALADAPLAVTVVDRQNYHLFQPLLYQVATAALSPGDIAWPIRRLLRRQPNARVLLGEVTAVDAARKVLHLGERSLPYDYLVLSTGVRHDYFGHGDWEPFAPGLKHLDDATAIRRRILSAFEQAEMETDERERKRLLTFVIVGAGPTGVELAGAIAELARKALSADFRHIDPRSARILLIEAGPRVLAAFPKALSQFALTSLGRLGVEVLLGQPMTACDAGGVSLGDSPIPAATILWAAGVAAAPAAQWLGAEHDRAGRVIVKSDLSVPGLPNVFVIGDAALVLDPQGRPVPGIAPAAKQAGVYVARLIEARIAGQPAPPAFRYRNRGNLATVGRQSAVIDFGWLRLKGNLAWWIWGLAHIYFLISLRNRLLVALQWLWSYLTFERGTRLITGSDR
ncbi:MAG: NAD(P)/FAD-dependent oxidoreductase [Pseudomonadota bacterium]|nr:NAD(P)/FAD-dependent oxidoreductase [Pseudomonadota bacterium]